MVKKIDTRKMVTTAMLAAIIVVLQLMSSVMNFSGFPITLTLVPIIVGITMYGSSTGAILGGVFGIIVCSGVITGSDILGNLMYQYNPALTLFVCMLKGIVAGYIAGVVYELFKKHNRTVFGTFVASILCPVINTGILLIAMVAFFESVVTQYALEVGFASAMSLILTGILVMNFVPELLVNIVVSPAVSKIVSKIKKD